MCFFGTCGNIDRVHNPTPIEFSSLEKIRCTICSDREDATGHRRDGLAMVESKLLTRVPIPEDCLHLHFEVLKSIWKGADHCNLQHTPSAASSGSVSPRTAPSVDSGVNGVGLEKFHDNAGNEDNLKKTPSIESITHNMPKDNIIKKNQPPSVVNIKPTSSIAPHPGLAASRWATAPPDPPRTTLRNNTTKIPSPTPSRASSNLRATATPFEAAKPSDAWPRDIKQPATQEQSGRANQDASTYQSPANAKTPAMQVLSTRVIPEIASMKAFLRI